MINSGRGNDFSLVSIGDSQTAARTFAAGGARMDQTYPFRIARARGYANVTNVGIGGNTTAQMLARFATDVLVARPGAVSIMGGVNDMATNVSGSTWVGGGVTVATTKANLKSMVQQAQAARARVTLCSWFPFTAEPYLTQAPAYRTMLTEIQSETGCEYFDVYSAVIALSTPARDALYVSGDFQHQNADGHGFAADLAAQAGNALCFAQL